MSLEEVGRFCYDFTNGSKLYPGYNGTDDCILGIARDNELLELYSAECNWDINGNDIMTNLKRLRIEEFNKLFLEFLYYELVDHHYILSKKVLKFVLDNHVVCYEWYQDYLNKYYKDW